MSSSLFHENFGSRIGVKLKEETGNPTSSMDLKPPKKEKEERGANNRKQIVKSWLGISLSECLCQLTCECVCVETTRINGPVVCACDDDRAARETHTISFSYPKKSTAGGTKRDDVLLGFKPPPASGPDGTNCPAPSPSHSFNIYLFSFYFLVLVLVFFVQMPWSTDFFFWGLFKCRIVSTDVSVCQLGFLGFFFTRLPFGGK